MEPYTPGFDVWSLVQLLEDMRRAAEAFGRSEIEGLFDASDAPSYEGELRDFLAEPMWKNVGDVDSGRQAPRSSDKRGHQRPARRDRGCKLLEEAFARFGGTPHTIRFDNLKEGVLKPDVYDPQLNALYAKMLETGS